MEQNINQEHLSPKELALLALDEESAGIESMLEHLQTCPGCRQELEAYRSLHATITDRLHRFDCPPRKLLNSYMKGSLPESEQEGIARHVEVCPACQRDLCGDSAQDVSTWRLRIARPDESSDQGYRTQRGAPFIISQPNQLEITLVPALGKRLLGKVTRTGSSLNGWEGCAVQLFRGPLLVASTTINNRGMFVIHGAESGKSYTLTLIPHSEEQQDMLVISDLNI